MAWTLEAEHPFGTALQVRRYRLHSGLGLLLLRDPAVPIVSYQTWYRVGSRHEETRRTGMAHLFEHLMFNQTSSLAPGEFDQLIERTGGDANAATWVDWTFYRDTVPAHHLELVVRVEADRMCNLVLEEEQLETERDVVMNERRQRVEDDIDGFLDEELHRLAFTRHPYHWPTIGWMEDIAAISRADVQRFYRTYYAPNNATLVVCGDIDEAATLALIERHYGAIPPAEIPAERIGREPAQERELRARFRKPVPADRVSIGYKAPGQTDPDWPIFELLSSLLCGGPSARLYRRLVVERELVSSVDSHVAPFRDPCLWRLSFNMVRGHAAEAALAEIDEIIADLQRRPIDEAELAKVQSCVETDFWSQLETLDGKGEALGHCETTLGDFRELFAMAQRLQQVSAADIQRAAVTYLRPELRTVIIASPGGDGGGDRKGEADSDDAPAGAGEDVSP
jgi:zinc protease